MSETELQIKDLPKGWKLTTVDMIGEIVTGSTPSKKNKSYFGADMPFFKPADLNNGYWVNDSNEKLSHTGAKIARIIPAKSILVTCIGATIGKTGLSRVQGATNQQINTIIPTLGLVIPEFVYYLFTSPTIQQSIISNSSSTTLPIINKSKFSKLIIPLPPINEQKRIVTHIEELFSKLDFVRRSLQTIKIKLKQYRQSLLQTAFDGELVPQDPSDEYASSLLEKILSERRQSISDLYRNGDFSDKRLPNGWACATVGDIFEFNYGKSLSDEKRDNGEFPVYGSSGIIGYHSEPLTKQRCLIIGRKGSAGEVYRSKVRCWPIDTTYFTYITDQLDFDFVYYLFRRKKNEFIDNSTAVPSLVRDQAYRVMLSIPPLNEQKRIVTKIEEGFSLIEKTERLIDLLFLQNNLIKNSILKQAFDGELVPQDPSDESVEILLEKIMQERIDQKPINPATKSRRKKHGA